MPNPIENDCDKTELHAPPPFVLQRICGKRKNFCSVETSSIGVKGGDVKRPLLRREPQDKDAGELVSLESSGRDEVVAGDTSAFRLHSISNSELLSALQRYFGYSSFREGQEAAVKAVIGGRDALVIMPTGGGKSVTYMLPGVLLPGIVLIISPLIALMKDQIDRLKKRGLAAATLNSAVSSVQRATLVNRLLNRGDFDSPQRCGKQMVTSATPLGEPPSVAHSRVANPEIDFKTNGAVKYLLVTPEQAATSSFRSLMAQVRQKYRGEGVSLLAVDEAHCISSWGHDFRSSYRKLAELRELLPETPVLACTATATSAVQDDICNSLQLKNPQVVRLSFNRKNIFYEVRYKDHLAEYGGDEREDMFGLAVEDILREIKRRHAEELGIIYCLKKTDCEAVAGRLQSGGVLAAAYHAALSNTQRDLLQQRWGSGSLRVLVATVAFGLGVDNPNVRFVFHFSLPKSIEAFYQESGRCGRDGRPARSILYYSPADAALLQFVLQQQYEEQLTRSLAKMNKEHSGQQCLQQLQQKLQRDLKTKHNRDIEKLDAVLKFCTSCSCRRKVLLQHFGEPYKPSDPKARSKDMGNFPLCCDVCEHPETACKQVQYLRGPAQRNGSHRKGQFEGATQMEFSPLEIERQMESECGAERPAGRKFEGKVVYHSKGRTGVASAAISPGVRKKGLAAVLKELERLEELGESEEARKSKGPTLFAQFRSAGALSSVHVSSANVLPKTMGIKKCPGLQKPLKSVGSVVGVPVLRPSGS